MVQSQTAKTQPFQNKSSQPTQPSDIIVSTPSAVAEPLAFPSPYHLITVLRPEVKLHSWQREELLRLGGFLDIKNLAHRADINPQAPLMLNIAAANGSGKDEFIIAAFNVWFALCGRYNLAVNTSSSFEQLKYQTEVHIKKLVGLAQNIFGSSIFTAREFYYVSAMGSEIKLFVTDEAGRAEGYHPRTGGKMAIIVNEAKSINDDIYSALMRCTGYSYWINISSPGLKQGIFYQECINSIEYPNPVQLGRGYFRRVTAFDCPHIPLVHIEKAIKTRPREWVNSSIYAQFTEYGTDSVIPRSLWETAARVPVVIATDNIYCLGADLAAGGDETVLYLRKGPKLVDSLIFREKNTTETAAIIHEKFNYILKKPYIAVFDDGGVGKGIIDNLVKLGWVIYRRHNQSAATNKSVYLNFGAESYFHLRSLLENNLIQPPLSDEKLINQICSRSYEVRENGKFRLEDKKLHKARLGESPDRADAFVLTYSTLPIELKPESGPEDKPNMLTLAEFEELIAWGGNYGKREKQAILR